MHAMACLQQSVHCCILKYCSPCWLLPRRTFLEVWVLKPTTTQHNTKLCGACCHCVFHLSRT